MAKADDLQRSKTTTILRELVFRAAFLCVQQGREDLAEGLWLLEKIAKSNPDAMRDSRAQLLEIVKQDDMHVDAAKYFVDHANQCRAALEEKLDATLQ